MNRILIVDDDSVTSDALPALIRSSLSDTVVDTAMGAEAALRVGVHVALPTDLSRCSHA